MKISAPDVSSEFAVAVTSLSVPVAKAAQMAIKDAGKLLKDTARAHIKASGFSGKWQKAYRVLVYPAKGYSIDAAAFGYFSPSLHYSDIFATGGRISGHPFLWIPFPTTPKIDRRKTNADIRDFKNAGVKMVSFKSKQGTPLMGVSVLITRAQANRRVVKLSVAEIEAGAKSLTKKQRSRNPTMVRRTIPLFHGVTSINIKKRFNWDQVVVKVQSAVPSLYVGAINKLAE